MRLIDAEFPIVVYDNLYNDDEIQYICRELDFLESRLDTPEDTGSAKTIDGKILKGNSGIWLDNFFIDRTKSDILKVNRKPFNILNEQCRNFEKDWWFKYTYVKEDYTLLSYYENSDYYSKHNDEAHITILTWFHRTPKSFSGGNLTFDDYDLTIECSHNRMVAFPSIIFHSVDKVIMEDKDIGKGIGRWCMSQFGHTVVQ